MSVLFWFEPVVNLNLKFKSLFMLPTPLSSPFFRREDVFPPASTYQHNSFQGRIFHPNLVSLLPFVPVVIIAQSVLGIIFRIDRYYSLWCRASVAW